MIAMEQFVSNFFVWLSEHWLGVGLVLSWVIQITPIKVNPWSAFLKFIGSIINAELKKELSEVKAQLKICIETIDANERDRLKKIIFDFGNKARSKQHISGEDFRFLQQSFKKYTSLGGNDIAHDEYVFVEQYYNESKWNYD